MPAVFFRFALISLFAALSAAALVIYQKRAGAEHAKDYTYESDDGHSYQCAATQTDLDFFYEIYSAAESDQEDEQDEDDIKLTPVGNGSGPLRKRRRDDMDTVSVHSSTDNDYSVIGMDSENLQ